MTFKEVVSQLVIVFFKYYMYKKLICVKQALMSAEQKAGRKLVKNKIVIFSRYQYDPSQSFVEINWRTQDHKGRSVWKAYLNRTIDKVSLIFIKTEPNIIN